MLKLNEKNKKILVILLIILMCGVIFFYQTQKIGFHEDEGYTMCSSVNPDNGVYSTYGEDGNPTFRTKEDFKNAVTLSPKNILNFKALYKNQASDSHPPIFYTLVHFSTLFFGGQYSKYSVFIVNIIAFALSCIVINKIFRVLDKENLVFPGLILYGLSMGTISMVIFQRMYMVLTLFILLYFYLNLKIYKNKFEIDKEMAIKLGLTTVCGFLVQYFFAIYAFFIFAIMIIEMIREKEHIKDIKKYICIHIICAILGILLFVPCLRHLLFSDRGITNLGNSGYLSHILTYIKHLAYAFTVNSNIAVLTLVIFIVAIIMLAIKSKNKFIVAITTIPSIFYFFIAVKMTSFQELRYVMPMIPFIAITLLLILDKFINFKYKNIIILILSILIVGNGFICSKPKFLYENYKECMKIANDNQDKDFVYIYDNYFNHMQSMPEFMTYSKSIIINYNNNELEKLFNNEIFKNEESYILCIKSYMNNEEIINKIKENTDFKTFKLLFEGGKSSEVINNNLYLVTK